MKPAILAASTLLLALPPAPPGPGSLTVPNVFQAGTPARADEVNANFAAVAAFVNGLADDLAALEVPSSEQLVLVAPEGTEHTSIAAALADAGVRAAQTGRPVTVRVVAGTYDLADTVEVPADVTLLGDGPGGTELRTQASPALRLRDRSSLVGLALSRVGAGGGTGIEVVGDAVLVEDVLVRPIEDGSAAYVALDVDLGEATARRFRFDSGDLSAASIGAYVDIGAALVLEDSDLDVRGTALLAWAGADVRRCSLVGTSAAVDANVNGTVVRVAGSELAGSFSVTGSFGAAQVLLARTRLTGPIDTQPIVKLVHCYDGGLNPLADG